ncbi:MAG TPA: leucine-rich repeat domain-containing protein [Sphingobacteriaceae bacterium]
MTHDLFEQLKVAYSEENLTFLTREILKLYKNNQTEALHKLIRIADPGQGFPSEKSNKVFARLMMLYHPDKTGYFQSELARLNQDKNLTELEKYTHIFQALKFKYADHEKKVTFSPSIDEDIVFEDEETGNSYYSSEDDDDYYFNETGSVNSFYNVFRRMNYGPEKIEIPAFLLEDLDELELCGRNMDDLDGISHAKHLQRLELSDNSLYDLTELSTLEQLEELYVSNNQISLLDPLSQCERLRVLDIADNEINDISPLHELVHLEYLNISGNRIPASQITHFKALNPECLVIE